jgi:ketosteroid isomerase-like protein
MSQENVNLIRSGYEAFKAGDILAVLNLLHPDLEIRQSKELPWGGEYHGQQGAATFFSRLKQHVDSRMDPDTFIDAGDCVVAVGRSRGRVNATGREFDVSAVHVWTVRDGKAARFEAYIDTPAMLRLLGPESASSVSTSSRLA